VPANTLVSIATSSVIHTAPRRRHIQGAVARDYRSVSRRLGLMHGSLPRMRTMTHVLSGSFPPGPLGIGEGAHSLLRPSIWELLHINSLGLLGAPVPYLARRLV